MKKKKAILWFAKNHEMIKTNGIFFNLRNPNSINAITSYMNEVYKRSFNNELDSFSYAFYHSGWEVYWTCMDFINKEKKVITIYSPSTERYKNIKLSNLDDNFEFIIFKYLGSVEAQRDRIKSTLTLLQESFNGTIINHPETIKYFIRKDYYLELLNAKFPVIQDTIIFPNTITYNEVLDSIKGIGEPKDFIIKPVTGELANSLDLLSDIGKPKNKEQKEMTPDEWLRYKENKVGGWIVQKYNKNVWNGEYRLVFLGSVCTLALRKKYFRVDDRQVIPSEKYRVFEIYNPTEEELQLARSIRDFWENKGKKIYFFRLDFIKSNRKKPEITILEFEAVNPGFGFSALPENTRKRVAREFVSYLNYYKF